MKPLPISDIENIGKALGLLGTVFTGLKAVVGYWSDHTWTRKTKGAMADIQEYIDKLQVLQQAKDLENQVNVAPYREQILGELAKALQYLDSLRERQRKREAQQDSLPSGARSWFLLYRPEGIAGWIVHSIFYFFALFTALTTIESVAFFFISIFTKIPDAPPWMAIPMFLFLVAPLFLATRYFRNASQRLKSYAIAVRKSQVGALSKGLDSFSKIWLPSDVPKPNKIVTAYRILLFFGVMTLVVMTPYAYFQPQHRMDNVPMAGVAAEGCSFLLIAYVLRADALARRALAQLPPSPPQPSPNPAHSAQSSVSVP